jgi:hypothetical protein
MAVNASSTLLFIVNANSTSISAYTIGSTGALTTVAPLNGGGGGNGLAIVRKP